MKAKQRIPNRSAKALLATKASTISLLSKRLSSKSLLSSV